MHDSFEKTALRPKEVDIFSSSDFRPWSEKKALWTSDNEHPTQT